MITGGIDEVGDIEFHCPETCVSKFIVYALFDPRDGELRYIGKSSQGLKRAKSHIKNADLKRHGRTHKTAWFETNIWSVSRVQFCNGSILPGAISDKTFQSVRSQAH
jgi:hypothetical protein